MPQDPPPSPSPSPSRQPSPDAAVSSQDSATDSTSSAFVADPGPTFDPGATAAPEPEPPDLLDLGWDEEQIRQLLEAQGIVLHTVAAIDKDSGEWLYTQLELRAIAGPLTRILNTYPATRAAAGTADPLVLMLGLSGYVTRSYRERRRLLAELDGPDVPITGLDPEPMEEATWTTAST